MFVPEYIDLNWNGDFAERMLVSKVLLAVGAKVKVWADRAFVADSNDRMDFAAITISTCVDIRVIENIYD